MTNERIKRFIELALAQSGKPYSVHYNSADWYLDKGLKAPHAHLWDFDSNPKQFDCSGLVAWLKGVALNIRFPHGTKDQQKVCRPLGVEPIEPCDLGFFERPNSKRHVIIHLHDGYCIEASGSKGRVVVSDIVSRGLDKTFLGWFRVDGGKLSKWRRGIL